jgi:hypothetical protein
MNFAREGAVEITVSGDVFYDVTDFDGEFIGSFISKAVALGAQREVNLRKLMIMATSIPDGEKYEAYACECDFEDDDQVLLYQFFANGKWHGPSTDLSKLMQNAGIEPSRGPLRR